MPQADEFRAEGAKGKPDRELGKLASNLALAK